MKHPRTYFPSVAGRAYAVIAIVELPKAAPHAGADSPRYLEAGKRGSVKVLRVSRNSLDVDPGADLLRALKEAIALLCGFTLHVERERTETREVQYDLGITT